MKRLIALCLVLILAFSVLPAEVSAKYQYIDYTRIYGGSTSKSYDVDASFGPLSVIGKLADQRKLTHNVIGLKEAILGHENIIISNKFTYQRASFESHFAYKLLVDYIK